MAYGSCPLLMTASLFKTKENFPEAPGRFALRSDGPEWPQACNCTHHLAGHTDQPGAVPWLCGEAASMGTGPPGKEWSIKHKIAGKGLPLLVQPRRKAFCGIPILHPTHPMSRTVFTQPPSPPFKFYLQLAIPHCKATLGDFNILVYGALFKNCNTDSSDGIIFWY